MTEHLPHPFRALTSRVLKSLGRDEDGSILLIVAIALPTLLLFSALAVDVAGWFVNKGNLRNAADSAALAAADDFIKSPGACDKAAIRAQAANYVAKNPNNPGGSTSDVEIHTDVQCPGELDEHGQTSYVDVTLTKRNVGGLFSKIAADITAHARASLLQVSRLGGSDQMPFAIEEQDTQNVGQLKILTINPGSNEISQSLRCDGTPGPSGNNGDPTLQMKSQIENGCPTAQVSKSGTCPTPALSPPSCLYQYSHVDEGGDFDSGLVDRFQNGNKGADCTHPLDVPFNRYAQYLSTGVLETDDPRVVTVYVVPTGSLTLTSHQIPIIGFAAFYMASWDHDPCADPGKQPEKATIDPPATDSKGKVTKPGPGTIEGYFIKKVDPSDSDTSGTSPCTPADEASSILCVVQLTQ